MHPPSVYPLCSSVPPAHRNLKDQGKVESNQPPPPVNAAVSKTPTPGSPGGAPVTLSLSLCSGRELCADPEGAEGPRAREARPPGAPPAKQLKVMMNSQPPVLWQRWGRARVPLPAGLQGADLRCPLGSPLTGCWRLASPGFPASLGACSWGLLPIPDPAPHPGLWACSEDISDATHPLPVSSQAAQSDKHQNGHPKILAEAAQ